MTLYGWGNPRYFPRLPAPSHPLLRRRAGRARPRRTATGRRGRGRTRRSCCCTASTVERRALHARASPTKAFARGMNVVRLNQRNCGGTEHLSSGLFHSGLTADAAHVIDELTDGRRPAGDRRRRLLARRQPRAEARGRVRATHPPRALRAVCAVSPISRSACASHALERPEQPDLPVELRPRPEEAHAAEGALLARRCSTCASSAPVRTVREFDDVVHGAALRVRGRRGLLPPRQRDARGRSHPRADARHHGRGRPVRPAATVPRSDGHRQPAHHGCASAGTAAIARFVGPRAGEDDGYWAEDVRNRARLRTAHELDTKDTRTRSRGRCGRPSEGRLQRRGPAAFSSPQPFCLRSHAQPAPSASARTRGPSPPPRA